MDEANQAYDRGDMKTAFGEYLAEAELGNAIAQYQIGLLYRDGLGTKQNYAEAAAYGFAKPRNRKTPMPNMN